MFAPFARSAIKGGKQGSLASCSCGFRVRGELAKVKVGVFSLIRAGKQYPAKLAGCTHTAA